MILKIKKYVCEKTQSNYEKWEVFKKTNYYKHDLSKANIKRLIDKINKQENCNTMNDETLRTINSYTYKLNDEPINKTSLIVKLNELINQ